jgi:peptidoglycan/LPS O-acetylase OafA/YrhL
MKWINLKSGVRNQNSYIYELESIRGIAVLLVFLFHIYGISFAGKNPENSFLVSFIAGGNTGVTLFFVLSGFLLSLPFIKGLEQGKHPSIRDYFLSRFLRIIPLYYLIVIISMIATGKTTTGLFALAFNYVGFEIFPYSVVWWTLSTEVQFYLLLPAVMFMLRGRNGVILLISLFLIWACWYYYYNLNVDTTSARSMETFKTKSVFGRLPAFLFGILTAYGYCLIKKADHHYNKTQEWASSIAIASLLIILGLILQKAVSLGANAEKIWHLHHSYEAICWSGILLLITAFNPVGKSLLINTPLALMGKLSYSIYLVHVPIIFYIVYPLQQSEGAETYPYSLMFYIGIILSILTTLFVSFASYQLIERPFLKMKQHIPTFRK